MINLDDTPELLAISKNDPTSLTSDIKKSKDPN